MCVQGLHTDSHLQCSHACMAALQVTVLQLATPASRCRLPPWPTSTDHLAMPAYVPALHLCTRILCCPSCAPLTVCPCFSLSRLATSRAPLRLSTSPPPPPPFLWWPFPSYVLRVVLISCSLSDNDIYIFNIPFVLGVPFIVWFT